MNTLIILFSIYIIIALFAVCNNAIHANRSYKIASRQLEIMELREHRDKFIYDIQKQNFFEALEKKSNFDEKQYHNQLFGEQTDEQQR